MLIIDYIASRNWLAKENEVIEMEIRNMREIWEDVDELRFWGGKILNSLSHPEDDSLYSAIEYAWKHPEEIYTDSVELTVIANSQVEDGEVERMIEEFYDILVRIAERNDMVYE